MPSTSAKQHRFMEAIAHSPSFAKKAGVPQSVGKDFSAADKGRTFSKGGATMIDEDTRDRARAWVKNQDANTAAPKAATVAPKAKIVTKEQLARSGFTNLRDYLNNERGLTRRADPMQPAKAKSDAAMDSYFAQKDADRDRAAADAQKYRESNRAGMGKITKPTTVEDYVSNMNAATGAIPGMKKGGKVDTKKPNPFMEMIAKKKEKAEGESKPFEKKEGKKGEKAEMKFAKGGMARGGMMGGNMNTKGSMSGSSRSGENTKIQKKGLTEGRVIKMASGGSVSSRADGIASRGKTNCKIC